MKTRSPFAIYTPFRKPGLNLQSDMLKKHLGGPEMLVGVILFLTAKAKRYSYEVLITLGGKGVKVSGYELVPTIQFLEDAWEVGDPKSGSMLPEKIIPGLPPVPSKEA